ncbi:outer membrane protein [Roseicyclus sp.]|jgi:outer membrane immunogenic protein|uniref:outer membrane protein n=1 Tax=Roseicyclus sp. TaxID=1914329 RepID=UPI004053C00A
MKYPLIFAAGLAAVTAGPVQAGGTTTPGPAPVLLDAAPILPIGTDWTGPSVGLQLGYGDVSTTGPVLEGDDVLFGLRAYYDYDFGDFILGGGLQYDTTDLDIGGVTTLDAVTRVGVRGGFDLTDDWVYGTAGWARAETSGGGVGDSDGWFAGLGYEMLVTDTISVGAELLYHTFDSFDLVGLEADATTAAVSVNFRF